MYVFLSYNVVNNNINGLLCDIGSININWFQRNTFGE